MFSAVFATFRFLAPRGPDAPGLINLMEFHNILRSFGAPGPISRKRYFLLEMRKCGIDDFLADFSFFDENQHFHANGGIAKTPIIP